MSTTEELSYRQFTSKSETDKATNSLKGILTGISADGIVKDQEIEELIQWCDKHEKLIDKNPFQEFMQIIKQAATSVESDRMEMIEDMLWTCEQYEKGNIYYDAVTAGLQTLQGLCHGIIADGEVTENEVLALDSWLDDNEHLTTYYPYDEIKSLINAVLADNVVDAEEQQLLKAYFNEFSDVIDKKTSEKINVDIENIEIHGLCTSDPSIDFKGKNFCFTGIAARGTRKELEDKIKELEGVFQKGVTKKTDYLIVGDNGNPCWAFACYGRKVEKAIDLRKDGLQIQIIHEFDFWDFVEDLV